MQDETPAPAPAPAPEPENHKPQPRDLLLAALDGIGGELAQIRSALAELDAKLAATGDGLAAELAAIRGSIVELSMPRSAVPIDIEAEPHDAFVPAAATAPAGERGLKAGDPVKVWEDPEHKKFRLGRIEQVEEGGRCIVTLDDGTLSFVVADGLAYDDRS